MLETVQLSQVYKPVPPWANTPPPPCDMSGGGYKYVMLGGVVRKLGGINPPEGV